MSHLPMSRQGMACLPAGVHHPRASGLPPFSCTPFAVSLPHQGGFGLGAGRRVGIYPRDGAWAAALITVSGSWGLRLGSAWCLQGRQASVRRERPAHPSLWVAGPLCCGLSLGCWLLVPPAWVWLWSDSPCLVNQQSFLLLLGASPPRDGGVILPG